MPANGTIIALYDDVAAAKAAQRALVDWDRATDSIELGTTALVYRDDKGRVHVEHNRVLDGRHGAVLGLIAGALAGGLMTLPAFGTMAALSAAHLAGGALASSGTAAAAEAALAAAAIFGGIGAEVGGVAGGAAEGHLGAVTGGVPRRRLGLKTDELERIGREIEQGRAALVVLCDEDEREAVSIQLDRLGGRIHAHTPPAETSSHAESVAEQATTRSREP
jgi:uncharacterized membrane protein